MRASAAIFLAWAAFCLSAFNPAGPPGVRPPGERPFYLPYQYSSFADDTALYENAYKSNRRFGEGGTEGWSDGSERPEADARGEEKGAPTGSGHVVAGTISHHLYIRDLIAQYFDRLGHLVHPRTIILMGPNHRARGHSPVALSAERWRTPFGFVEPDRRAIGMIAESGLASIEEEPFVNEHSIGALVPFIRKSFPGARIVPVIFKKVANREDCVKLGRVIAGLTDSTLVLASLDFSHYKMSDEAEKEDSASLCVLRSCSPDRVDEAFVDSRPALATLMQVCTLLGAHDVGIVQHTNSGIISRNPRVSCTSYINALFRSPAGGMKLR